ncbi:MULTISPECIES: hypothetical protein [Helicobacter]|uniref:DUF177 domain-containing protein n=1 Tax=Helicobacter ibis TaxID=2962633 RepID=A0ABT4VFJ4_9HELI|nr:MULTISPECIES: hypothetical protein [Helicobacter]MDA3967762.1 hypothetical protein [Helicobacter sp. WB40]MDA3969481.1 hypothetical protein [Helicobacter ibis]
MNKIPFLKAFQICRNGDKIPFSVSLDSVSLDGYLCFESSHSDFLRLCAKLTGSVNLVCDISGDEYLENLDENLDFYLSNGAVSLSNETFEEVLECEGGIIDFEDILRSEIEIIICDYHIKE